MSVVNHNEVNELKFELVNKELERHDRRISNLENNMSEVTKLSTLMELQLEMNKNQDELLRQQSETLVKVNENLTSLHTVTVNLGERIDNVEKNFHTESNKSKIDLKLIGKVVITGIILGAIVTILTNNGIPFIKM